MFMPVTPLPQPDPEPTWPNAAPIVPEHSESTIQDGRVYGLPPGYAPPTWGQEPTIPSPAPPRAQASPQPAPPQQAPPPTEARRSKGLMVVSLVVIALLLVVIVLAIAVVGSREPAPVEPTTPVVEAPPAAPEAIVEALPEATSAGVPIRIELEENRFQWARVLDTDGNKLLQGDRTGVEGNLEPGSYWLGVKRVGRGATTVAFELLESGLYLRCEAGEEGVTPCFDSLAGEEAYEEGPVLVVR